MTTRKHLAAAPEASGIRRFLDAIEAAGGLTREEAHDAFLYFQKHKLVVVDTLGQFRPKHGAYLEREAVRRAAALGKSIGRSDPRKVGGAKRPKSRSVDFAGYQLDLDEPSLVQRSTIDTRSAGDYGADPLGDGTYRMVPSGDVVDFAERNRRLARFAAPRRVGRKPPPAVFAVYGGQAYSMDYVPDPKRRFSFAGMRVSDNAGDGYVVEGDKVFAIRRSSRTAKPVAGEERERVLALIGAGAPRAVGSRKRSRSPRKWSTKVTKGAKYHPPRGLFLQPARVIADVLARDSDSVKQAVARVTFYQNRAGRNLSTATLRKLGEVKRMLRAGRSRDVWTEHLEG